MVSHSMLMRCTQFLWMTHEQIFPKVVGDCRMEVVLGCRNIMTFCLGLLAHLLMHGPALRPLLAPIIPSLDTVRDPLKVIGIHPVRNKPRSPVIYRTLN